MPVDPRARAKERAEKGYSDDGPSTTFLRATGKFPMAVAGWERFNSSQKGTPGLMVRLVAVEGEHAGDVMDRDFWLTQNALFQLADFALAFGYEEPFNEHDDDDLERVITHGLGVIVVTVQAEGYTKNDGSAGTRYNAAFFGKYKGQKKDSWGEHIKAGEKSFEGYLRWRENNPRGSGGGGSRRGGGGGGGGGGGTRNGGGSYGDGGGGANGGGYAGADGGGADDGGYTEMPF